MSNGACVILVVFRLTLACASDDALEQPFLRPQIASEWWQVAANPDLGVLTSDKQQVVDFGIWQAKDGKWQLWSCIRGTKEPGHSRLFYRWEGTELTQPSWEPQGIAMQADIAYGEQAGGLQAPFVLNMNGMFHMFYGGWDAVCLAISHDGKHFTRKLNANGKSVLFGPPEGYDNPRDPMVLRLQGQWHCYFTAHTKEAGAVFCRTSNDLLNWSEVFVVAKGGQAGSGSYSAECPFVVEFCPGQFYLFRTQRYGLKAQTSVYWSNNPHDFGLDHDDAHFVCTLPVAAPEVITYKNQWYIAALTPSLSGIQIARLEWLSTESAP
ncbi:MAG: hypothetical protein ACUVQG_09325 [Thermogutta sp.]